MEFSAESEEAQAACKVELHVVKHRLSVARHVIGSSKAATASKAAMDTYIKSFGRSGAASEAGSTSVAQPASSGASNELALWCGPCPGFQNLQAVPWLLMKASKFKDPTAEESIPLTSAANLQKHVDSFELAHKAIMELTKALKA